MKGLASVLLVLALLLVGAGCGGDDESSGPQLGDGPAAGAQTSEDGSAGDDLAGTEAEDPLDAADPRDEAGGRPERDRDRDRSRDRDADRGRDADRTRGPDRDRDDGGDREADGGRGERGAPEVRERRRRRERAETVSPADPRVRDDVEEIKATVRRFVDGIRTGDGGICDEVFTQHYMEVLTGERGEEAVRACRAKVSSERVGWELGAFGPIRINRDVAVAEFNVRDGGEVTSRRVALARTGGRWKIDAP